MKVSVIVPIYNASAYIERGIGCLLAQTLDELEIIAVDDCSEDNSVEILQRLKSFYPEKLKVITLSQKRGAGGARMAGIAQASADYIGFMDCDDVIDGTMYEKLYKAAIEQQNDITDCGYYDEKNNQKIMPYDERITGVMTDEKRRYMAVAPGYSCTKLFAAGLFGMEGCVMRENVIYEDLDFLVSMILHAQKTGTVREILYTYKYNEQSSSYSRAEQKKFDDMYSVCNELQKIKLSYGQAISDPIQYLQYNCICAAVGMCLTNQENSEFALLENIRKLKRQMIITCAGCEENEFISGYVPEENRQLTQWLLTLNI